MQRGPWITMVFAVALVLLAVIWWPRNEPLADIPQPTTTPTVEERATPAVATANGATPDPTTASNPQRTAAARPILRVFDSEGQAIAASVCWRTLDGLVPVHCGIAGTSVPAAWSEVAVRKANWLPVRFGPDAVQRSGDSNDNRERVHVQLPPPVLVADVVAPRDRLAEVQLRLLVSGTPFTGWDDLDAATLPAVAIDYRPAFSARQLPLDCRGGRLEIGGLTSESIVLDNAGDLLFRRPDGHVLRTWQSPLPNLTARIELGGAPMLRVTTVLVDGEMPRSPRLRVEQFDRGGSSIDVHDVGARLGATEVIPLVGGARRVDARVIDRRSKGDDERPDMIAAAARVILRGGDEDLRLEIGRGRLAVTVQNESGTPVAGAMLAEWNDLLGITDDRGQAWIQSGLTGQVEVVARGYDYAQVASAELQRHPVITLRAATGLVIDGRAAAQAMPGCRIEVRGEFLPPMNSALRDHYFELWIPNLPTDGLTSSGHMTSSGTGGDYVAIAPRGSTDSLGFELVPDRELELIGMFRPGSTVHLKVQDDAGADTAIAQSVKLQPGQRTRVELPAPEVRHFVGHVVNATDGTRVTGASYQSTSWWPIPGQTALSSSTIDLRLATSSQLTLSHPNYLPRTWEEPEPDGLYRLEPARSIVVRVVDGAGAEVPIDGYTCRDGAVHLKTGQCTATATPLIDGLPNRTITLELSRASTGTHHTFTVPADVTEWTAVWP